MKVGGSAPTPHAGGPDEVHEAHAHAAPPGALAEARLDVPAGDAAPRTLRFEARAPGADFGKKGHESTAVEILVDGRGLSTETILAERADPRTGFGPYSVNLGVLPPGPHRVEVRPATDLAGPSAKAAEVRGVSIASESGLRAEIERYAPLLATKHVDRGGPVDRLKELLHLSSGPDLRPTITHTDVPLRLRAEVTGDPAGLHAITYRVTFSDEDDGTSDPDRMKKYGRTTDDEWLYKVLVDGSGRKVSPEALKGLKLPPGVGPLEAPEMVQYGEDGLVKPTRHQPRAFDGKHQGDRPLVAVHSGNNNFAALQHDPDTPVWSPAVDFDEARRTKDARGVVRIGARSDKDVIAANPWVAEVSRKEIGREG